MSDRPKILDHLGPFVKLPPVAAFGSTSERAYELYREAVGGHERKDETTTQHLVTCMMYIAEATGVVLRLGASWGLSHPALSLLRDRYEQTVRFSWLARQPNNHEMVKYVASHYAKSIKLYQSLPEAVRNELGKIPVTGEGWITEKPTKEQLKYLDRWNALDLRSMAQKRDALPPVSDCPLAQESLSYFYTTGIYAQFSSVTHYDMYSMSILGLHKSPDGQLVLAADPGFPSMINLHNALFDLIQCFEASRSFLGYRARFEVLGSFCRVARICLPRNRYGAAHPSGLVEEQDSQPFLASLSS